MALKLKKSQALDDSDRVPYHLKGPWGQINGEPHSAITLRVCAKSSPTAEEIHSYPYRTLARWHWRIKNSEEVLEIEAGSDLVMVKGRGLIRLVDALDQSTLEILRETPAELSGNEPIHVSSIRIADASARDA